MAASILSVCQATFSKFLVREATQQITQPLRWASKKASGSSRNKRKNTKSKKRGAKKLDGDYVEAGMILLRQLGLKIYPGENVGCGKDLTLFALRPGRVMITRETLAPYPNSPLYPAVKAGRIFQKYFFHVIPLEAQQIGRFKLISSI